MNKKSQIGLSKEIEIKSETISSQPPNLKPTNNYVIRKIMDNKVNILFLRNNSFLFSRKITQMCLIIGYTLIRKLITVIPALQNLVLNFLIGFH